MYPIVLKSVKKTIPDFDIVFKYLTTYSSENSYMHVIKILYSSFIPNFMMFRASCK